MGAFFFLFGLSFLDGSDSWALSDQTRYHLPQINLFLREGFTLNYEATSTTTPASHLFYATLAWSFGIAPLTSDNVIIPIASSTIGALTLSLAFASFRHLAKSGGWAAVSTLPLLASQYFMLSAVYAVTEGLSYLFFVATFSTIILVKYPIFRLGLASITLAALVLTRQILMPFAAVLFLPLTSSDAKKSALHPLVRIGFATIPALAFLPLYMSWQGLVPPSFQKHYAATLNLAPLFQSIALFGLFSIPALPLIPIKWSDRVTRACVAAALIAAVMMGFWTELNYDHDAGRSASIIWILSQITAYIGLPHLLGLALMGVGFFVILHQSLTQKISAIRAVLLGYVIYSIALCAQAFAWQRYSEFFALYAIALLVSAAPRVWHQQFWRRMIFVLFFSAYLVVSVVLKFFR